MAWRSVVREVEDKVNGVGGAERGHNSIIGSGPGHAWVALIDSFSRKAPKLRQASRRGFSSRVSFLNRA